MNKHDLYAKYIRGHYLATVPSWIDRLPRELVAMGYAKQVPNSNKIKFHVEPTATELNFMVKEFGSILPVERYRAEIRPMGRLTLKNAGKAGLHAVTIGFLLYCGVLVYHVLKTKGLL